MLPLHTPADGRCSCGRADCGSPGKHPRAGLGLAHATKELPLVERWWGAWPSANVGLRCDGLLVLDLDGNDGEQSLERLEHELSRLPKTREQVSGRGRHLLFGVPATATLGNSTAPLGDPAGLDLRAGSRGYIVAAPSAHVSGRRYTWVDPELPVSGLPARWLERLLRRRQATALRRHATPGPTTAYGRAALYSELERLLRAPVGDRNETLNRGVFRLAQLVAGGELDEQELRTTAYDFSLLAGLTAYESEKTIEYAIEAGKHSPRQPIVRQGKRP